jgi:hypothetical protein
MLINHINIFNKGINQRIAPSFNRAKPLGHWGNHEVERIIESAGPNIEGRCSKIKPVLVMLAGAHGQDPQRPSR